jgi:L-threonylcarbamoyladenylate synthase
MSVPSWSLRRALRALRAGGIVAYPTEAVYGLGCDPFNEEAVRRLLSIKGRAMSKGLILIAAHFHQLRPLLWPLDEAMLAPALASWPGPSTWVLPAAASVPAWISGGRDGLAVRVTAHPLAARLCALFGAPLVSTSANASGRRPARSALGARRALGAQVDYVLNGAVGGDAVPSVIRDARDGRVLRAGAAA